MTRFEREFLPVFSQVCADAGLSAESRAVAWQSCHLQDRNGKDYLDPYARDIYYALARVKPPFESIR